MRQPFAKASPLCSPSIGAFPFSLDVSCILIYISRCLTVYAKEKRNDEKIDMKALSSNECIIMTLIMTWLFEKRNTIIFGYSGVQSLISLKVRAQFWVYRLCRGNLEMSGFAIRIAVSRIAMSRSVIAGIDSLIHRRSQIANVASSRLMVTSYSVMLAICDIAYRRSAVLEGLLLKGRVWCMRRDELRIAASQSCFSRSSNSSAFLFDAI